MQPLDLRTCIPRGPRESRGGLLLLPRTIDKARGLLPGGNPGEYRISPGLSDWFLRQIGLTEAAFLDMVASETDEEAIVQSIMRNVSKEQCAYINQTVERIRIKDIPADLGSIFREKYGDDVGERLLVDVLEEEDQVAISGYDSQRTTSK